MKTPNSIKSNLTKLTIRYRAIIVPVLFVLLLPLLSGCILGFEYRQQVIQHVPFAVVDHDNSQLTRQLIENIRRNNTFNFQGYGQNDEDIENWIETGRIVAGMIIPPGFSADMLDGKAPKILVVYDGAQMSMAGQVKSKISEILGTVRIAYLLQVMEGNLNMTPVEAQRLIQPIAYTNRFLGNPTQSVPYFILPGILANITQIAVFILSIEMARFGQRKLGDLCKKGILAAMLGTVSLLATIGMQNLFFTVPFQGSFIAASVLIFLNMICIANLGILIRIFVKETLTCLEFAALVMATLLLSGYTFPIIAMPDMFHSINPYVPFTYIGPPLRDISLLGTTLLQNLHNIWRLSDMAIFSWIILLGVCKSSQIFGYMKGTFAWLKERN